ncbi:hypothetical protein [Undibacterium fentianense]|uniref:DUF4148 domain-containing protein n=1 Tax=Undibacterium fentianense TaxID=2828728 RepID=A0A941ICP5_9BURK|nr:hypothetical protein [Undibacterium fentianense]MBR7800419.1 hypothetical protein [Undibacterium fentianense]
MKTSITGKFVFATVSAIAIVSAATAFQSHQITPNSALQKTSMQKVTIAAKRMSPEEKLAYDLQSSGMQTVVISAKRLSPEQKVAMDEQDRAWQAATKAKKPGKA